MKRRTNTRGLPAKSRPLAKCRPITGADFLDPDELDPLDVSVEPAEASPAAESTEPTETSAKNGWRLYSAKELMETDFSNEPVNPDPYGEWEPDNGNKVLFNRGYEPLWIKHKDGSVERADPSAWINGIVKSRHFWYDWEHPDRCQKTRKKLDRLLKSWGVRP